jgi:hypothetical protein
MKTIELTPKEYLTNFKEIAKFNYQAYVLHGIVYITARIENLDPLGY